MNADVESKPLGPRPLLSSHLTAWLVLLLSLLGTLFSWRVVREKGHTKDEARFNVEVERILWNITDRLLRCEDLLNSGQGLFAASKSVEREEWERFVARLDLEGRFGGLSGLFYVARVPRENLAAFLDATRADGAPGFYVKSAGKNPEHAIIKYAEPASANAVVLGFDAASIDSAKTAQDMAADTGHPTLTTRLNLVGVPEEAHSVVLYLPVYRNGLPRSTPVERRIALEGWIAAPIGVDQFIRSSLEQNPAIHFQIHDGEKGGDENLLFDSEGQHQRGTLGDTLGFSRTALIDIGGRVWRLNFKSRPVFHTQSDEMTPLLAVLLGLVGSGFLFHLTRTSISTRRRAVELAERMTASLREREAQLSEAQQIARLGNWNWNLATNELVWSPQLFDIFDIPHGAATVFDLFVSRLHVEDRERTLELMRQSAASDTNAFTIEFRIVHLDGSLRHILAMAQIRRNPQGRAVNVVGISQDITERKLTQQALQASEDLFRLITENAVDLISVVDTRGNRLYLSPSFEKLLGYTTDELMHQPSLSEVHPDDQPRLHGAAAEAIRTGVGQRLEYRMRDKNGVWHFLESTASVVAERTDDRGKFVIVARDITDRKQAEGRLRAAEERLQMAVTSADLGLWDWDIVSNQVHYSSIWKRQLGYDDNELPNDYAEWEQRLHPNDRTRALSTTMAYLENPWPDYESEFRLRHKDGSYRWILCKAAAQLGDDGKPRHMMGAHIDITERKLDEERLRESQEQLRSTFEQAAVGIAHVAPDGRWLRVNERLCQFVGYTQEELVTKRLVDITHPEDLQADIDHFRRLLSGETVSYTLEQRYLHKNGSTIWIELTVSLVRDDLALEPKYFIYVAEDISERKRAEAALTESEARFQRAHAEAEALLSSISAILVGVDVSGKIARWNFAAEQAFGIPAGLALGRPLEECGIKWNWSSVHDVIVDCLSCGKPVEVANLPYQRPDGKEGCLHLTLTPSMSIGDEGLSFVLLGLDNTKRRLLEDQLRQAQKLESIGQLAAGIAHEINTPIQFIGDNLRFLQDGFSDVRKVMGPLPRLFEAQGNDPVRSAIIEEIKAAAVSADLDYLSAEIPKALEQSLDGVNRVAKIVQAMKDFSHPDGDEKKLIDLNKSIEATITVARNEWKYVADLAMNLAPTLPPVPCLQGEFNQVILNLTVNAAHAIADTQTVKQGGKGTITVSTRCDGDWVEIRIGDTGTGIPEKSRPRIFDPFFTTKPVGKGTGQGLFIAHTVIAEKHAGTLAFETEMGRGTTFIIRLPLNPAVRNLKQAA